MKTTFIGGGNMATALIGGLVARGIPPADLRVVEPGTEARARLAVRHPGVAIHGECTHDAVAGAELIVFAVKPQHMREAARALAPHVSRTPEPLVLSIAAGIRLVDLARWLGGYRRLARAMPNTPALVGKGVSGLFAAREVDAAGRALAAAIVEAAGEVIWVRDEAMLDAVTGVSGSGPAYVFYFLEALEDRGARARVRRRRGAPARLCDVRRSGGARAGEPGGSGRSARAGDVEGRHHRARDRSARGGIGRCDARRRSEGGSASRRRARRSLGQRSLAFRTAGMLDQALSFLLDTVFGIITYAFLLRFLMQWLRAPFRNPLGQAVVALTDWAAKPLRRVVPGFRGLDVSTLVLAWLAQISVARRARAAGRAGRAFRQFHRDVRASRMRQVA